MAVLLVSPAEPLLLRRIGTDSPLPESLGADFLLPTAQGLVGAQRKTISDLIASLYDDRVHQELSKMRQLPFRLLIIEGQPRWAATGEMLWSGKGRGISLTGWWGLMLSLQAAGIWVLPTGSLDETAVLLTYLPRWFSKSGHTLVSHRAGPSTPWGRADNRDWAVHLLQGFEKIGPEIANNIYEHFGGVPLQWTVTEKELMQVKGIAKGRAKSLIAALARKEDGKESDG